MSYSFFMQLVSEPKMLSEITVTLEELLIAFIEFIAKRESEQKKSYKLVILCLPIEKKNQIP